jgi:hypothetical protein
MIVLFNKKLGIFFGRREKSWECGGEHGIISQPGAMYVFLAPVFYGIAWSSSHCWASSRNAFVIIVYCFFFAAGFFGASWKSSADLGCVMIFFF